MQKSVSQSSTQYKQKFSQNAVQEMQNKLQSFQQSLLQVSNKHIHANDKQNLTEEAQDNQYQNCQSAKRNHQKYKNKKHMSQNVLREKTNENQVANDQYKQTQSNDSSELFGAKTNDKQNQNVNSQLQSTSSNQKNVEVLLPAITQSHQKADNYYLLKGKNQKNNKYSNEQQANSLHETVSSRSSTNFQNASHGQEYDQVLSKSTHLNKKNQDSKYEENSDDSVSTNEQKKRVMQGVQELKKLRERRFTFRKLKKIDKLKQRISVLQDLEKQIPLIQDPKKQKEIEDKLNMNGDGATTDMSFISQDDCFSRNSDDFIFQKLDQISVTEMSEENDRDRINEIDEIVNSKENNKNQQECLPNINTNYSKSSKLSNALECIMEEHQDYFNHIAGKCACGQCECGRCHVKCFVNQKKPQIYQMTWESSYSRSYSHSQNNIFKDKYDIKMMRKSYQAQQPIPFDYTSTFKRDFQHPPDINFQKVVHYDKIKDSPLYSLSNYKSNYVDWKIAPKEVPIQYIEPKTVVQGTPLIGSSTMKKDYQVLDSIKTNSARPPDQSPLPRFSINKSSFKKQNDYSPFNIIEEKNNNPDILKSKKQEYIQTPSYEGQFQTSASVHKDLGNKLCEGNKKLYAMYQRKIEKYQKRLQEQIERLEQAK